MPPRAAVSLTAATIANLVDGRLEGDGELEINAVGSLDRAHGGALSFLSSSKYIDQFVASAAGAVLVPNSAALPPQGPQVRIFVADPYRALAQVVEVMFPAEQPAARIHRTALLGRGIEMGDDVSIGPYVVLGDEVRLGNRVVIEAGAVLEDGVRVGDDTVIGPRTVCHSGTILGARVRIKAGAVLGGIGFGYVSDAVGHHLIPHVGGCVIEDDVHIGSNTTIDRGSVGDTVVGAGSKVDNQVHVGHNARIGARCLIMGGVMVAGSARIGNEVVLAGHSAVGGHISVGDRARVGAKSGVISSVPTGTDVTGFPARPHREFLRAQAALYRLVPLVDSLELLAERKTGDHD